MFRLPSRQNYKLKNGETNRIVSPDLGLHDRYRPLLISRRISQLNLFLTHPLCALGCLFPLFDKRGMNRLARVFWERYESATAPSDICTSLRLLTNPSPPQGREQFCQLWALTDISRTRSLTSCPYFSRGCERKRIGVRIATPSLVRKLVARNEDVENRRTSDSRFDPLGRQTSRPRESMGPRPFPRDRPI